MDKPDDKLNSEQSGIMMTDTTPEAKKRQEDIFKRLSGAEKVKLAMALSDNIRDIAQAGLRSRYPSASERELKSIFFRELYGIDIEKGQGTYNHE
jgi:hypothetical protein